jgi:YidC/Oxa1 family membrane protein insertase
MELYTANIFDPLINLFDEALTWLNSVGLSWGLSIIVLTILIRIALIPLTYKQITSMAKMQEHQPEIKAINEKYKEDPQRKQEELMKFFKENGINPFASCLPLLAQLPFFIAMFYALQDNQLEAQIRAGGESFLFIESLVEKASGAELVILIVLYVGTQLASSLVSMSSVTDDNQRRLMLALPLLFVPFIINFQAGLILYWITSNTWTIGQAYVAKRIRHSAQQQKESEAAAAALVSTSDVKKQSAKESAKAEGKNGKVAANKEPAAVAQSSKKAPPPPPRQKKKRSGRRR